MSPTRVGELERLAPALQAFEHHKRALHRLIHALFVARNRFAEVNTVIQARKERLPQCPAINLAGN